MGQMSAPSPRAWQFRTIYLLNRWRGTETRSGPGSSMGSTRRLREALPGLMAELGVTSVLDAACGASWWMPDLPGYVGVDIVAEAIKAVSERFPERTYAVADICTDTLPKADAVIARDVLAHLPTADVKAALSNIARMSPRYLLATTFVGADNRADTKVGGYHEIDLAVAPFDLGEPLRLILDGYWEDELKYPNKHMGVWQCAS